MKLFWRTKGKRLAALLLAVLIMAGAMPVVGLEPLVVQAEGTTGEGGLEVTAYSITDGGVEDGDGTGDVTGNDDSTQEDDGEIKKVFITGSVMIPGEPATAYEGAMVTVTYPEEKEATTTTDVDGNYTIEITDWSLKADDTYAITVIPKTEDAAKYKEYFDDSLVVTAENEADQQLAISDITLEKQQYTITYTIAEGGKLVLNNDESDEYTGDSSVTVEYTNPYELKAAVTDEKYHLTSVKINTVEQLTEEDTAIGNDCDEKTISLPEGLTEDVEVEVTAAVDQYIISISQTGEGSIGIQSGTLENNQTAVEKGGELGFVITPGKGYEVTGISVNEEPVPYSDCTGKTNGEINGSYVYTISDIAEDKAVNVTFTEIDKTTQTYAEAGIIFKNQDNEQLKPEDTENTCYVDQVTVSVEDGKVIRLADHGVYQSEIILETEQNLGILYICEENPSDFGAEQMVTLNPSIQIVVDSEAPTLALDNTEIWKSGTDTTANITGMAKDENLDRVVWSATELDTEDEILKCVNTAILENDGAFAISGIRLSEGTDTDTFYIYAIDKIGHCSAEEQITIYRDGTAPVISNIEFIPTISHAYSYGNFFNSAVTLKVTAKDVETKEDGTACPASGIKTIQVYAGDAVAVSYTGTIGTEVSNGEEGVIEVTIPIGDAEAFADLKDVRMVAVDELGNASEEFHFTDFSTLTGAGLTSDKLMLEARKPVITVTLAKSAEGYYEKANGTEVQKWYKEIPEVSYFVTDKTFDSDGDKASDGGADETSGSAETDNSVTNGNGAGNGSGLVTGTILLNGTELTDCAKNYNDTDGDGNVDITDYASVTQEDTVTISAETFSDMKAGENTLYFSFTDHAGNTGEADQKIYIDNTAPQITGFSLERGSSAGDKILNMLTFGNYSNGEVVITVMAEDGQDADGNVIPSAGLHQITLYLDDVALMNQTVVGNTAKFVLPLEQITSGTEQLYLDKKISASVCDMVGNESAPCDMTTGNSNMESSRLMIETVKPAATIALGATGYLGKDGIVYNNTDTDFSVKTSDANSGLRSVKIDINGTVLVQETYSAKNLTITQEYTVNTKDVPATDSGLYIVTAIVVDNAGNECIRTAKVYKDETAPQIMRFDMQVAGTAGTTETAGGAGTVGTAGIVEADGLPVSVMDYGYYFYENTKVTVSATDGTRAGDSGVREIHWYTVDVNGTKSDVQSVPADEEGKASFIVPAEFKGQVYACAFDQLRNHETDESGKEKYVTPSSLIIETPEQHTKEEHISYKKVDATYKDSSGGELYADNVTVGITITDTFSGIRRVEWSVEAPYDTDANQSGSIELDNEGNFTSEGNAEGWSKTKTEKNLVTELQKSIVVSNNSNDIVVHVTMTDRAGNTSEKEIQFGIDRTKPQIQITFDNEVSDAEYQEMFKEGRIATITVTERNFSGEDFAAVITNPDGTVPQISEWQTMKNTSNPDETTSTATITFSEDGDYTLEMSGHDRANNAAETVTVEEFTIDKTLPVITVTYDNENATNGNYYAEERTATIQIEEHNFSEERVQITGTATDGGETISFPAISGWSGTGDTHTATILCETDGLYRFDVEYRDMAGNEAEMFTGEEYYVDMTEPEIEITGVEDMSANNGDVIPKIALSDTNYDMNGVTIELTGANKGAVTPDGTYTTQAEGQIFTFRNFPKEQARDDIYTLTATLTDMAGNESTDTISFSVNRFGSVYVFDNSLKEIAGTYIQDEIDVKLTEVNVDSLEHDKIKVVVDANGTVTDLVEGTDYTVQETGGNGSWHQYDYTIDKSLFAGDGRYIVTLYSEDVAGNVNENIDESKEAEISFGVDKTAPVVIPIDIESDAQYAVDVKQATVAVNDNLVLQNVEVYVGENKCECTANGENYSFQVPSAGERQDVTIAAVDAAGNRTNYVISGVLVTTNAFIRWYNNKALFAGTIAGVAAVAGASVGGVAFMRSGRISVKRKKK